MSMAWCAVYVDLRDGSVESSWYREIERKRTTVMLIDRSYCTLDRIGIDRLSDSCPADGSGLVDFYIG